MTTSGGAGPMTEGVAGGGAELFLLALLNTTPVVDGAPTDELADPARGRSWLAGQGGDGTEAEWRQVRAARDVLQAVVRGDRPAGDPGPVLAWGGSLARLGGGRG